MFSQLYKLYILEVNAGTAQNNAILPKYSFIIYIYIYIYIYFKKYLKELIIN